VGGCKLGAFAEELGAGLEVRDTAVEVKGMALEGGKFRTKEGRDEIGAANRLAKVTSPANTMQFGFRAPPPTSRTSGLPFHVEAVGREIWNVSHICRRLFFVGSWMFLVFVRRNTRR
jgi:hypothetical protein